MLFRSRFFSDICLIYSRYTTDCQSLTRHFFISFSIVHTNKICLIHIYSGIQSKLKCTIVWIHKSSPALFFFIFPSWNQIPMCTYLSFETLLDVYKRQVQILSLSGIITSVQLFVNKLFIYWLLFTPRPVIHFEIQ